MGGDCSAAAQSTVNIYGWATASYCAITSPKGANDNALRQQSLVLLTAIKALGNIHIRALAGIW